CALVSGSCSVTFTATATGTALITGAYGGDSTHATSTSAAASVTVNLRSTSSAVSCTSPVVVGQASTCTATVTDTSPGTATTPTGTVTFTETGPAGSFSSTTCALVSGSCSVSFTATTAGSAAITGAYGGDSTHATSTSAAFMVTVTDRPPVVTIGSVAPNPANTGQTVTVTFTAADPDGTISSIMVT